LTIFSTFSSHMDTDWYRRYPHESTEWLRILWKLSQWKQHRTLRCHWIYICIIHFYCDLGKINRPAHNAVPSKLALERSHFLYRYKWNYMCMCTVKGYDILEDKHAWGKSVNYVTECAIKKCQYPVKWPELNTKWQFVSAYMRSDNVTTTKWLFAFDTIYFIYLHSHRWKS
jgi:hypothetical protein